MTDIELPVVPGARISGTTEAGVPHEMRWPGRTTPRIVAGWVDENVVSRAVEAAVAVRDDWGATSAARRAAALQAIASDLRSASDELAALVSGESGKRLVEAGAEVEFSARYFEWFAEAAVVAEAEQRLETSDRAFRVRRHPVGVVAAVGTWNFPLSIPARKVAPALAAGCPVVLKPSERTPASAESLVRICERHLPRGVIGFVSGDGAALVGALVDHPQVAAVTFTGSTAIGERVGVRAAASNTRVVLELGGRAPFIVREDADVASAVEHLLVAKFRNSGQSCIAANNVFVHETIRDRFVEDLALRVRETRPGDPADPSAAFGPLIDAEAVERLEGLAAEAEAAGMRVVRGSGGLEGTAMPAVLVDCPEDLAIWRQEIFGPVIVLRGYTDEDDVVAEVNSWGLGLAGYVCGTDAVATEALAARLRVGIVGVNNGAPNTPEVPFGGFGASGIGREGGMSGYDAFTEEQTISIAR